MCHCRQIIKCTHRCIQCADAIQAGVDADGPALILHTGTGSGDLERAKGGGGSAYIMPDWVGRMASKRYNVIIS